MKDHKSRLGHLLYYCTLISLPLGTQMAVAASGLMRLSQSEQEVRPLGGLHDAGRVAVR